MSGALGDVVVVPLWAPPGWAPAWEDIRLGETLPRGIDATQWADAAGFTVTSIAVSIDPALSVSGYPVVAGARCTIELVAGGTPGVECLVDFLLTFADGVSDRLITVRQPIRAGAPAGLVPVAPPGPTIVLFGGAAVTLGGQAVTFAPPPPSPAALFLGSQISFGGQPLTIGA